MRKIAGSFVVAGLIGFTTLSSATADSAAGLKALDPDNDGTIDLAEAQAGGAKLFKNFLILTRMARSTPRNLPAGSTSQVSRPPTRTATAHSTPRNMQP